MAKVGRPTKYRADFHPEDFLRLSNQGKVQTQIARAWKVDRECIANWALRHKEFSDAVKKGKQWAEAWWQDMFQNAAIGIPQRLEVDGNKVSLKFNAVPAIWLTKNAFGWADKVEQNVESKVNTNITFESEWGSAKEAKQSGIEEK